MGAYARAHSEHLSDGSGSQVPQPYVNKMTTSTSSWLEQRGESCSSGKPIGSGSAPYVRVARSMEEVSSLRSAWEKMQWHPNADIDFYQLVARSRSEILRPHVISVMRDGVVESILVGRLELKAVEARLGYGRFAFPAVPCLAFLYGGMMGNRSLENSMVVIDSILESLKRNEGTFAVFNSLEVDSNLFRLGLKSPGVLCRDYVPAASLHRSLNLPEDFEDVSRAISPKTRKNLKWQAKKLLSDLDGEVAVRCFSSASELEQMIKDVESIAKQTYQRGLGVGFVDDGLTRDRLRMSASQGWLRTFVLYIRNTPCAFWVGTLYKRTFHSDFMGYDRAYAKYSPGMFLIMKALEELCSPKEGGRVTCIDFGLGDAQYKTVLGDKEWRESSMCLFAPNLRGVALNLARTPMLLLNQLGVGILSQTDLLPRAKKLWRARANKH
jgi:hypothetical protein